MSNKPLQISWNTFSAGMNDQKYQGQAGRYYNGFNVDTRRFDVRPGETNSVEYVYPEARIIAMFNTSIVGGNSNVIWDNDGNVYFNETLKHTFTLGLQGEKIGNMKVGGVDRLYYFHDTIPSVTPKYIHRSNATGSSFLEGYRTYDSTDGNNAIQPANGMQVVSEGDRIIFSHYNKLIQIDNAEIVTELLSFPSNENIVGITQFLGEYKIYTSTGVTTSSIYTWDGSSSEYNISVNLNGLFVSSVVNRGAYDYIIADRNLYKVSGVQYQKLYDKPLQKILGVVDEDIYISYYINGQAAIAVLGSEPGYKESLTPKYLVEISDLEEDIDVGYLVFNSNQVFMASGRNLLDIGGSGQTPVNLESYIESLVFMGDSIEYRKQIEEARIKFSGANEECIIQLHFDIDESGIWVKIWEGKNGDIAGDNHGLKIPKSGFLNTVGNFNTLRMKVSFIRNGDNRAKFYGVDLLGTQDVGK